MGIKQGDQYYVPIKIKQNGNPLDLAAVSVVEIAFGELIKEYPSEIVYDAEEGAFLFPVTQEETFAFRAGSIKMDVRVKFTSGNVVGIQTIQTVTVPKALSREVL